MNDVCFELTLSNPNFKSCISVSSVYFVLGFSHIELAAEGASDPET